MSEYGNGHPGPGFAPTGDYSPFDPTRPTVAQQPPAPRFSPPPGSPPVVQPQVPPQQPFPPQVATPPPQVGPPVVMPQPYAPYPMVPVYPVMPVYSIPLQPEHPRAGAVLVLGILGLFVFWPLGPVAWIMGRNALKECNAGQYRSTGPLSVGHAFGTISTILVSIGLAFLLIYFIGAIILVSSFI
ncbi:MAG: DUF4190 domain-containing protein [Propionibacteriaceae bacterium]|nr:DUF4190 domain-containing protein [Propionibacteriaceae bacterium]